MSLEPQSRVCPNCSAAPLIQTKHGLACIDPICGYLQSEAEA